MLEVERITKRYGPNRGIEDLSLQVRKGEILGLLGPNGAGKTTTLRIITGYLPADSGRVRVDGYDLWEDPYEVRRRIGYLPDNPPLYAEMTVLDYLTFMAELHEVPRARRVARVDAVIERLELGDVAGRLIGRLSRGYRQRVGLAQAVLHEPSVLVCDEPTVGLDPAQIVQMRELLRSFSNEHAVIFSSHILSEVQQLCHEVVIIHQGRVHARGKPSELAGSLEGAPRLLVRVKGPLPEVQAALAAVPGVKAVHPHGEATAADPEIQELILELRPGHSAVEDAIFAAMSRGHWSVRELRPLETTLEQIFLELTASERAKGRRQQAESPAGRR